MSIMSGLALSELSPPSEASLLQNPSSSAKKSSSTLFEVQLSDSVPPWLGDSRAEGSVKTGDPAKIGSFSTELSREVKSAFDHGGRMSLMLKFISVSRLRSKPVLSGVGGVKSKAGVSPVGADQGKERMLEGISGEVMHAC